MKNEINFEIETDPQNLLEGLFGQKQFLATLRRAFESKRPPHRQKGSVPKIIHQIWLGSPLPRSLQNNHQTWRRYHPDWKFKIWTDSDIAGENFSCRDLVEKTTCYGQKSDMLRAEIVYRYGGVYVDLDYECYRPLDPLIQGERFFTCLLWIMQAHLGWPKVWRQPLVICNALFGAEPGHPVLKSYLERVREIWDESAQTVLQPGEIDKVSLYFMGGRERAAHIKETGLRTYLPFHNSVSLALEQGLPGVMVFPPTMFNPVQPGWPVIYAMPQFWKAWKDSKLKFPRLWEYSRRTMHTRARHKSQASWLDKRVALSNSLP